MSEYTGRLLAIGDIHGHREKLEALMEMVCPSSNDKVIFLGDYIDRGPDSRGVIEFLLDFGVCFPGVETHFLRGNHEQMFLDALAGCRDMGPSYKKLRHMSKVAAHELYPDDWKLFLNNGGRITFENYGVFKSAEADCSVIPAEHIEFLKSTRFYHKETVEVSTPEGKEQKVFLFVHAGIATVRRGEELYLEKQDPFDLLWIRDPFITSNSSFGGMVVVHGHTPSLNVPGKAHQRISLDSGVYMDSRRRSHSGKRYGKLTCCDVLNREYWQAG